MIRKAGLIGMFLGMLCLFGGCTGIGDKSLSLTVIYSVTAVAALLLLLAGIFLIKRREPWFLRLFACVAVVNVGYLLLSLASTLEFALFANSLAYLGSVFLPPAMLMIILGVSHLSYRRFLPVLLALAGLLMFCLTLTPLYYTDTALEISDGAATLVKEYGPLHALYPVYLFAYFAAMVTAIVQAIVKKRLHSLAYAILLLAAVFINISVWLLEQLVRINFEFLSVSYIISELFLLGLYWMSQAAIPDNATSLSQAAIPDNATSLSEADDPAQEELWRQKARYLHSQLSTLTPTERAVLELYLDGKGTKEVLTILNIKENTLKYHNRNLYGKLGVSSRKELLRLAAMSDTAS